VSSSRYPRPPRLTLGASPRTRVVAPRAVPPLAPVAPSPRSLPVAVFDSGVGGLTVLHECLVSLPHEDFVYLGDTARFPYGDRPPEELLGFARELSGILVTRGAKLLVVACNSATAAALPSLRDELEGLVPVVGVVRPESRLAAAATRNGKVGLLATPTTVQSGAYARALEAAAPGAELHAVASAELAPLIQEGGEVDHRVVACVDGLCRPLRAAGVDTVILGCTHYPLVRPVLQRALGRGVVIVSSGEAIATEVEGWLRAGGLENDHGRRGDYRFLATADPEEFRRLGTRFLQLPIGAVEQVRPEPIASSDGAAASRVAAKDGREAAQDGRLAAQDGRLAAQDGRLAAQDGRLATKDRRLTAKDGA
jgi:glutamate racemase